MTRELAREEGHFGLIRILERCSDGARLYCIDSSIQTMAQDGVSLFGYVHAAKILLRQARSVVVIGGAGGSLATMLARRGHKVLVVDIDPAAERLARDYFDLDPRVRWVNADGLDFLRASSGSFDAVFIDACNSVGLVQPFSNAGTIASLMAQIRPNGLLLINLVHEDGAPPWGAITAAAVARRGLYATLFRAEEGWEGNELLRVSKQDVSCEIDLSDLQNRPSEARTYLLSLRARHVRSKAMNAP